MSKAGDIYGMNNKLLKIGADEITINLTKIFNFSISLGQFPDKLKVSMIIPIHKGDSKCKTGNYRPISLLPIIGKILEKIMFSRVYNFIQKTEIITKSQYGFQKDKSTEDALMELHTKVIDAFENKKVAYGIFLDFAKAFDTVNHEILLHKLEHYGIRGLSLSWFKSYLTDRQQCVNIDGTKSDFSTIKHGVPQGSILGPLLFLLYINDIVLSSKRLQFLLFADDTSIFATGDSYSEVRTVLNDDLNNVSNWLKANKLSLNIKKSNALNFKNRTTPSKGTSEKKIEIKIDGNLIEEKEFVKYLGILIDNKLSYSHHTSLANSKLNKGNAILYRLRHFVSENKIKDVYHAHIQSHINYGLSVWGSTTKTHLNTIAGKQKKSLKIMYFKNPAKASNFQTAEILKVKKIRDLNWGKRIWKASTSAKPYEWMGQQLNLNPRENGKYLVPFKTTLQGRNSIFCAGIKIWNKIPISIKEAKTISHFCRLYKEHLLY